jgi:hypothetical protein
VIYDTGFGLTEVTHNANSISFRNSGFYEATLPVNHAILISGLFLLAYSFFAWKKKAVLISLVNLMVLSFYLYLVV